jgi:hypothetical protein
MTEDNSNYSWDKDAQEAKEGRTTHEAQAAQARLTAERIAQNAQNAKDAKAAKYAKDVRAAQAVLAANRKNPFYSKHRGSEITNSLEALIAINYWVSQIWLMLFLFFVIGSAIGVFSWIAVAF